MDKTKITSLEKTIKEAANIMMEGAKKIKDAKIKTKGDANNFVTEYDVAVQRFLEKRLSELFPDAAFLAEEDGDNVNGVSDGLTFVIDPIDGTANFMFDIRHSAISVALLDNGSPLFAAVYNPYNDEYFSAVKGQGAYLNQEKISVSDRTGGASVISIGSSPYYKEKLGKDTAKLIYDLLMSFGDIRRFGSAALDICYVAAGRFDGFCEMVLSPWDFAAATLIVEEAGGKLTDFTGNTPDFGKPSSILCSNAVNFEKILNITQSICIKGECM